MGLLRFAFAAPNVHQSNSTPEWDDPPSFRLVAVLGSVIGLSKCYCDCCLCLSLCSCMRRGAGNNDLYFCAMKELEQRGATLDVQADGGATLQEKYCHLAPATVAFLWQFPPSFVYSDEIYQRLERLVQYLASSSSGVQEARHIVDFRDGSWYREDVYDFLRQHRWCLAWLHLNNSTLGVLPNFISHRSLWRLGRTKVRKRCTWMLGSRELGGEVGYNP
ncbi:unnamed protein product [Cladocopium goreaui]|uniref:Cryptochrome-2 n=1 Tax=Cladocopium goreaui TaxID=2562237 RepID=A0A9P1DK09_9DINO|nr:unnamed protein product [Cladocopium goreaui]